MKHIQPQEIDMNHKPATPLPFKATLNFIDARNSDGSLRGETTPKGDYHSVATCHGERGKQHAAYIAHAANAYPKLVEAMRYAVNRLDATNSEPQVAGDMAVLLAIIGEAS